MLIMENGDGDQVTVGHSSVEMWTKRTNSIAELKVTAAQAAAMTASFHAAVKECGMTWGRPSNAKVSPGESLVVYRATKRALIAAFESTTTASAVAGLSRKSLAGRRV
jgi:hypothetical protein